MTGVIEIAAEAERHGEARAGIVSRQKVGEQSSRDVPDNLPAHQFPTVEEPPEIVRSGGDVAALHAVLDRNGEAAVIAGT